MARSLPITGHTELIGLVANPIRHSLSPAMHNAAFDCLGMDRVYLVFEVAPGRLGDAVNGLKAMDVRGWNVSMPFKGEIMQYMDELSPRSRLCGAVNTVVNDGGKLSGDSTDGPGWARSIKDRTGSLKGKKLTLLGAGGAATAIMVEAALEGMAEIAVFNRNDSFWERGVDSTARIRAETGADIRIYHLEDNDLLGEKIAGSDILTNATSAGMKPQDDICLVEERFLRPGLVVSDCVYNPRRTILIDRAERAGCNVVGGVWMMLYQGADSFRRWTGEEMPVEYVKEQLGL